MTDHDEVFDVLRRAQPDDLPDELVSAHAPAAQALLEEILSMETIQSPHRSAALPPAPEPRRQRRRPVALAAAAAAVVAFAAAAVFVVGSGKPSEATTVRRALATSQAAVERSGRADVDWEAAPVDPEDPRILEAPDIDATWAYDGDDVSITMHDVDGFDEDPINLYVDGELYYYFNRSPGDYGLPGGAPEDPDGAGRWFRDDSVDRPGSSEVGADPAALLGQLQPAGSFERVGTEQVDGVDTRRLRATHPEATPTDALAASMRFLGEVTRLELWVDEDDLVRRIELTFAGNDPADAGPDEAVQGGASVSIRFSDFGQVTLEVPTLPEDG